MLYFQEVDCILVCKDTKFIIDTFSFLDCRERFSVLSID